MRNKSDEVRPAVCVSFAFVCVRAFPFLERHTTPSPVVGGKRGCGRVWGWLWPVRAAAVCVCELFFGPFFSVLNKKDEEACPRTGRGLHAVLSLTHTGVKRQAST